MYEILEKDMDKYKLIGSAGGASFGLCIYLAQKHTQDFSKRAVGYRIEEHGIGEMMSDAAKRAGLHEEKQKYITVSFYEEKFTS